MPQTPDNGLNKGEICAYACAPHPPSHMVGGVPAPDALRTAWARQLSRSALEDALWPDAVGGCAASMKGLIGRKKVNPNERLYSLHPAWHRFMDRTFQYLTTSGLNGIIIALHKVCTLTPLPPLHLPAPHHLRPQWHRHGPTQGVAPQTLLEGWARIHERIRRVHLTPLNKPSWRKE